MAGGRPTTYKPEYCKKIIDCMSKGNSAVAFAVDIKVCRDTLHEWAATHPEFSDAYKQAQEAGQRFWEEVLQKCAQGKPLKVGGEIYKNYNITAMIFLMKARFRDYHELKAPVDDGNQKQIPLAYVPKSKRDAK